MNISKELVKIRNSFLKVKEDITFLSDKIYDNYDEFMKHHLKLVKEVKEITTQLKIHSDKIKETPKHKISDRNLYDAKSEIKELKKIVSNIQDEHKIIEKSIDEIKENKKDIKDIKEKYQNSELEIYLLKERLLEKDVELSQIKEINKHMFNTLEELTRVETELLNKR